MANQTILITAGGSGIGRAIATAFLHHGDRVHVADINQPALQELKNNYPTITFSHCDVSNEDQVQQLFADLIYNYESLDTLINCAGIAGPTSKVESITLNDWHQCLAVNLDATFLCTRSAVPIMLQQKSGNIINISSTAGLSGYPLRTPYASAKWAIIGFTKSVAMELGPYGVRANVICPGSVAGERMEQVIAAEAKAKGTTETEIRTMYKDGVALRTFIEPNDIADAALFLASAAAKKITGQSIPVDGYVERMT